MTKLKYTLKSDTLFKMLFSRNQDLLKRLVAALLGIKYEDITEFSVINPEISPEEMGVSFMSEAIMAYRHVAASPEFREMERVRSKARHDEAQAIYNAELKMREQRDEHWQGVVDEKDARIAELEAQLKNQQ